MLKYSARPRFRLFALTAAMGISSVLGLTLGAQEDDDFSDAYELSPFEVTTEADSGYLSTNSTSGTSLNTAIRDLPMAIQVINKDMITDLGAGDLEESLSYAAGVFTDDNKASSSVGATRGGGSGDKSVSSAGAGSRFSNNVYIRGLATPFQNRNGFRYGGLVVTQDSAIALGGLLDSSNMERVEVVKGPNSLLYGVGVLSGIVNVIPQKPLSDPRYELTYKMGSYDYKRATFDFTGPVKSEIIPGELDWRLAGSFTEKGDWTDFREDKTEYWVAQLNYKPVKNVNLFLEYQDGRTRQSGIDSQWVYDQVNSAKDTEFRNEYDEAYNWARYDGTIEGLRPLDPTSFAKYSVINSDDNGTKDAFKQLDSNFVGGSKADSYRISGPDTFAERDEQNFLADLEVRVTDNFTISAGAFLSQQETEELSLHYDNASIGGLNDFMQNKVGIKDATGVYGDAQLRGIYEAGGVYGVAMQDKVKDLFGIGVAVDPSKHAGNYVLPSLTDDIKLTEYWWERSIVKSKSEQYRIRGTYTFEADIFGSVTSHTLLAGFSYIQDDIDFPDGNVDRGNARADENYRYAPGELITDINQPGEYIDGDANSDGYNQDGYYWRSIANFEPFYLDGSSDNVSGHNTVRAGDVYLNQVITQKGLYGVYQGKFFNDRLELIMGMRHDVYNSEQGTYKRVNITDAALEQAANTWAVGQGIDTSNDDYIASYYRAQVESPSQGYFGLANRGGAPDETYGFVQGSQFQIFEKDVEVNTGTLGISFDLTDDLTIYGVLAQGVSPNTALRDGAGAIIPAEETFNKEIGLKFDLFNGKLSGSLSFFQIERENAIWDVDLAPAPAKWYDAQGSINRSSEWTTPTYDPETPTSYYVDVEYYKDFVAEAFNVDPSKLTFGSSGDQIFQTWVDPDLPIAQRLALNRAVNNETKTSIASDSNGQQAFGGVLSRSLLEFTADGFDDLIDVTIYDPDSGSYITKSISSMAVVYGAFMNRAVDKEKNGLLDEVHPIRYRRFTSDGQPQTNNNPSFDQAQGALVTFDETINGFEFEVFYSPLPNLQFVFGYTHVTREANDTFQFVDWESIVGNDVDFFGPFTMLHREFGWEQAGLQVAWVDSNAYENAITGAAGNVLSASVLGANEIEYLAADQVDETILPSEFASRNAAGQVLVFVDKRGNIVNENNNIKATDYTSLLSGVSLNFNPEDEFTFRTKYTFDKSGPELLEGLSLTGGLKYIGSSKTSVAFNSVSPLNELTLTPEVSDRIRVDFGLSYEWDWHDVGMKLSLNVYDVFEDTYDVTTTTLGVLNPVTGEEVTKRTEKFYSPTTYRIGLAVSF